MIRQNGMCVTAVLMIIVCAGSVQAGLETQAYNFGGITYNNAANAVIGQDQLGVMVSGETGGNQVTFKFTNEGPAACVLTEIYFQDNSGLLSEFIGIDESLLVDGKPVVDFEPSGTGSVNPNNLPGGKSIAPQFIATAGFTIEPVNPDPMWGINPGEWVAVTCSLQSGKTYDNVIQGLNNETLRIGIHVQAFADDGSESFINTPEPATMVLLGLGGLMLHKRRKI